MKTVAEAISAVSIVLMILVYLAVTDGKPSILDGWRLQANDKCSKQIQEP